MKKIYLTVLALIGGLAIYAQPFGSALKLDGVNDYAENVSTPIPDSSDFTIETFFYTCSDPSAYQYIFDSRGSTAGNGVEVRFTNTQINVGLKHAAVGSYSKDINYAMDYNKWNHFAFVHDESDTINYIFMNGVLIDSIVGLITPFYKFTVGKADYTTANYFHGFMDGFRISKVARYTSNFTPPSSEYIADSNTLALWSFNDTEGSASFNDASPNNLDLTGYGGGQTRFPIQNASAGSDTSICLGDSVQLSPSGGTIYIWQPFSYLSCDSCNQPKASPPSDFTYSVSIYKDSLPCPLSDSMVVFVNPSPIVTITGDTTVCKGQSLTLSASGTDSYTWSSGGQDSTETVSPTTTTTYIVTGIDSNTCSDTASHTIIVKLPPSNIVSLTSTTTISSSATGVVSYQWIDCNNSNLPIAGETGSSYTATVSGSYAVIVDNGCADTSVCVNVIVSGIQEHNDTRLSMYPNPATDHITIIAGTEFGRKPYIIVDNLGKIVKAGTLTGQTTTVNISELSAGSYIIRIEETLLPLRKF